MEKCDVAIIGAGPYGLSAAAHLGAVKGVDVKLLGEPMSFWEQYMPQGMLLRSPWSGSHFSDPRNRYSLESFRTLHRKERLAYPIPVGDFINYGHWFHEQLPTRADRRKVIKTELATGGFRLTVEDGQEIHAARVIIAGGIQPFAYRPEMFSDFPKSLVTHTSELREFSKFKDKRVLVVGAGQSALETAAFLQEAGAEAEVLIRNSTLRWLRHHTWTHSPAVSWMFYGSADVGPAGLSLLVQRPNLFRRLPRKTLDRWAKRAIRPAVSHRLQCCVDRVLIHTERFVVKAKEEQERLRLVLNDGSERLVDHLILATGYRVNVAKYPFLSSDLVGSFEIIDGYPRLKKGFETTLPGLHFIGAPAAWSFGPLMRFVAGTEFTAPALARSIVKQKKRHVVSVPERAASAFEPISPGI